MIGKNSKEGDHWRRLDQYRSDITSQNGEDGIIAYLLSIFPEVPKVCLEVGAGNGRHLSNTFTLWNEQDWKALLIEASGGQFAELDSICSDRTDVIAVHRTIKPVGSDSLDEIAKDAGFDREFGVISIDIDANDLEIFRNLTYIDPAIVVLEFNYEIPVHVEYTDPEGDLFLRHSAKAVESAGREMGYRTVACPGSNVILLNESLIDDKRQHLLPDLPIEALFDYDFVQSRAKIFHLIGAKFVSSRFAFSSRPRWYIRPFFQLYCGFVILRDLKKRRKLSLHISHPLRDHIRRSGLWI